MPLATISKTIEKSTISSLIVVPDGPPFFFTWLQRRWKTNGPRRPEANYASSSSNIITWQHRSRSSVSLDEENHHHLIIAWLVSPVIFATCPSKEIHTGKLASKVHTPLWHASPLWLSSVNHGFAATTTIASHQYYTLLLLVYIVLTAADKLTMKGWLLMSLMDWL